MYCSVNHECNINIFCGIFTRRKPQVFIGSTPHPPDSYHIQSLYLPHREKKDKERKKGGSSYLTVLATRSW
jgi:hypothetical protein